jgi:hypothetical protein
MATNLFKVGENFLWNSEEIAKNIWFFIKTSITFCHILHVSAFDLGSLSNHLNYLGC